jgi:hypothetical protein
MGCGASSAATGAPAVKPRRVPTDAGPMGEKEIFAFHSKIRWCSDKEADGRGGVAQLAKVQADLDSYGISVVKAKDPKNGNFAIHIAAQNGNFNALKLLLVCGADANAQNNNGVTALHMSVEYNSDSVTELLLANKANPNIENEDGHKAITGIDGKKSCLLHRTRPRNSILICGFAGSKL